MRFNGRNRRDSEVLTKLLMISPAEGLGCGGGVDLGALDSWSINRRTQSNAVAEENTNKKRCRSRSIPTSTLATVYILTPINVLIGVSFGGGCYRS